MLVFDYGINWNHFCFKGICEPKANNWVFDFICNNIAHWRTLVKSIYVIKHKFIKKKLFWDVIETRWQYVPASGKTKWVRWVRLNHPQGKTCPFKKNVKIKLFFFTSFNFLLCNSYYVTMVLRLHFVKNVYRSC